MTRAVVNKTVWHIGCKGTLGLRRIASVSWSCDNGRTLARNLSACDNGSQSEQRVKVMLGLRGLVREQHVRTISPD